MSDEQPNTAINESMMEFYFRKKKFPECMIVGWQQVEYFVNQMTLQEFDLQSYLPKEEPRTDLILDNVGFPAKLKFLKDMRRLSQSDYKTIHDFQEERNRLFHARTKFFYHPSAIPDEEKTRLMELACSASQIAVNRSVQDRIDEGTGDIGNKNTKTQSKGS
ncbi:MAG TPA: hypothetical protein VK487_00945 [Candidatus Bathyarchaeia archaeon]|nr:hypothetical protein [Candidatus Bathyarchaeia archaeon]